MMIGYFPISFFNVIKPSFGVNEQARIMDLFKERKKNRKKKGSNRNVLNPTATNDSNNDKRDSASSNHDNEDFKSHRSDVDNVEKKGGDDLCDEKEPMQREDDNPNNESPQTTTMDDDNDLNQPSSAKKKKKKKKNKASGSSTASEEGDQNNNYDQKCDASSTVNESQESASPSAMPPLPPPGFHDSFNSFNIDDHDPPQSDSHVGEHLQFSSLSERLDNSNIPSHPNITFMNPQLQTTLPQSYIIIPPNERPNLTALSSNVSLAVAAAKTFIEIYYSHISHGLASELATYYTHHAQKSISVGGAHHVVATRSDIMLQLSKFSGSNFMVRGVVSQDTFDNEGAHVLITGIVATTSLNDQTCFAHSVSLVKKQSPLYSYSQSIDDEFSFQIHNDALSLLTMSDLVLNNNEQQSQPI